VIAGEKISGFVITYNEEKNIRECLETLRWVDELVIVDSYSEDGTVEIACEYTDRIIRHPFAGYVAQAQFASEQTSLPWVMWLDADERLTQRALDEIREFFTTSEHRDYAGAAFPRKAFFMNRWVLHSGWYPAPKLRLFHRDRAAVGGREPSIVVETSGKVKHLKGDILHLTYPRGVTDMLAATNRLTGAAAKARYALGRRFSPVKMLLEPPFTFLKRYLLQRGFLDGMAGLVIAAGAAYYRFLREVKMWELEHLEPPPPFRAPTMKRDRS